MSENLPTGKDRRIRQRFKINVPVTSLIGDREVPAYTRDLSNRGVFFNLSLTEDTQIDGEFEFMVDLPPEVTLSGSGANGPASSVTVASEELRTNGERPE